jgi:Putative peptidoglycan binding domain
MSKFYSRARSSGFADCLTKFRSRTPLNLLAALIFAVIANLGHATQTLAQESETLKPGEAFITRFSGTTGEEAAVRINPEGVVGSIIDLRAPSQPPSGQHWLNEPQRRAVKAAQVGQIFGVAIDDAEKPNIYVTATAAFGLHRQGADAWMAGMWGKNGGPGTVYKLNAENGYAPEVFATISLDGRQNSGAALGTIAYDAVHRQLLVSDLETGMIHRLSLSDGKELGRYDHGANGRPQFYDVASGSDGTLPAVAFNKTSTARIADCPDGAFEKSPACWNVADFRRRVWGLGVREDPVTGEVRLYYSVWSSDALGNPEFAAVDAQEKRNSVWSVGLKEDGSFDTSTVVREFFAPGFQDEAGKSHPITKIAFPKCTDQNTMLISERGGLLNRGIDTENAFSTPHESRILRYTAQDDGSWNLDGRYPVGHYARADKADPKIRANASGGVDFSYGYTSSWRIDVQKPDQFVWMTGDALCTPFAPCFNVETGRHVDGSHVHGTQGIEADKFTPEDSDADETAKTPLPAWMVDTDINIDSSNKPVMSELTRNDATRIGDIAVYQPCDPEDAADTTGEDTPPPVTDETIDEGEPPVDIIDPPIDDGIIPPPGDGDVPPVEEPEPDLEKSKTGPAECIEGGLCTFTVTITNLGPGVWSGPLFEHDTLPPGATLADYGPQPDWICTQAGDSVDCEHVAVTLIAGASITLTLDVQLPPGLVGEVENCIFDVWQPEGPNDDPAVIEAIEQRLNALGFLPGPIDGVLDAQTQTAIIDYQNANGLAPTGDVTDELRESLFPGMAGLSGDANPDNDSDCHVVEVLPPPPPLPPQPIRQPSAPPAPPPVILATPPPPPVIIDLPPIRTWCPTGTIRRHGQCIRIIRRCPPGTVRRHGQCVRISRRCPEGTVRRHGICVRISRRCPRGTVRRHGRCVKITRRCPEGTVRRHGQCVRTTRRCPPGTVRRHGRCVKVTRRCPEGTVRRHGQCVKTTRRCPPGTVRRHGRCVKATTRRCPEGTVRRQGQCVKSTRRCPRGTIRKGGRCVRIGKPGHQACPKGTVRRGGRCVRKSKATVRCPRGLVRKGNRCVKPKGRTVRRCPPGTRRSGKKCIRIIKKKRKNAGRKKVRRPTVKRPRKARKCPPGMVRKGKRCVRRRK